MKKETSKITLTINWLIIMIAAIVIIFSAIKLMTVDKFVEFTIAFGISMVGVIVFDFAQLFLYLKIDKRDRLD